MPVPARSRVQYPRQAARRIVAHDGARLDPAALKRLGLQLDVLDDCSPEGPRIRCDDSNLHRLRDVDVTTYIRSPARTKYCTIRFAPTRYVMRRARRPANWSRRT